MTIAINRKRLMPARHRASTLVGNWLSVFGIFTFLYLYSDIGFVLQGYYSLSFRPSYFYVVIVAVGLCLLLSSRRAIAAVSSHIQFIAVLVLFGFLVSVHAALVPVGTEGQQILLTNIEYVAITSCFIVIFSMTPHLNWVITGLRVTLGMIIVFNLVDYFLPSLRPFELSSVSGRASGLYYNANDSATYICMALPLACYLSSRIQRYAWYAMALLGILVTFSRGGMVLLLTAVILIEFMKQRERTGLRLAGTFSIISQFVLAGTILAIIASSLIAFLTVELAPYLDDNTRARLTFATLSDDRVYLLMRGFEAFFDAPIFGNGVGFTRDWAYGTSVHNTFVLLLSEQGIIGGLWMLLFLLSIGSYGAPFGLIAVLMFATSALFTHNLFEWPAMGILIALYLVLQKGYARQENAAVSRHTNFANG